MQANSSIKQEQIRNNLNYRVLNELDTWLKSINLLLLSLLISI
ncbi:MAG: hypothetical protein QXS19_08025 [Candidatus Methanomethylicia archaeon]